MATRTRDFQCSGGNGNRVLRCGYWIILTAFLGGAIAHGGLPEPDIIYYGFVSVGGVPQGAGDGHLLQFKRDGQVLASYELGELGEAGDFYVLRVKVESPLGGPISTGAAQLGDEAALLVNEIEVADVQLGARGRVTRMDITGYDDISEVPDFDGDGTPDFRDLCWLSSSQVDSDGNGIADDCEGSLHPGLRYSEPVQPGGGGPGGGNAADPLTDKGSVAYVFHVTQTEVTNADYMDFLNAVAAADPGRLYSDAMGADPRGGIVREGSSGSHQYKVKPNMANKPVNFVSWLDAARYSNWLENGKPTGAQDASTTEAGAFDLSVDDPAVSAVLAEEADQSLPTEDEWYKAAYYEPGDGSYWRFPSRSNDTPTPATANQIGDAANPGANVANYAEAASWAGQSGNVTGAGSAQATSPSGLADAGGNVAEWLADDAVDGLRLARGGSYRDSSAALDALAAEGETQRDPDYEGADMGFRVLSLIPEPGADALAWAALAALAGLSVLRRRSGLRGFEGAQR